MNEEVAQQALLELQEAKENPFTSENLVQFAKRVSFWFFFFLSPSFSWNGEWSGLKRSYSYSWICSADEDCNTHAKLLACLRVACLCLLLLVSVCTCLCGTRQLQEKGEGDLSITIHDIYRELLRPLKYEPPSGNDGNE